MTSDIGPIKVSPRFFCRMISCPAANGIICSNCRHSATDDPSGTCLATASYMECSLDTTSPPTPVFASQETRRYPPACRKSSIAPLDRPFLHLPALGRNEEHPRYTSPS